MLDGVIDFSDGWTLREDQLRLPPVSTDALFATSNGLVGLRGRRREPIGREGGGMLLAGCYETRPYAHPEEAFGSPEQYQTLVEVTEPMFASLAIDGEAVGEGTGTWLEHRRTLDLRTGCVSTAGTWQGAAGARSRITSRRFASLEEQSLVWTSIEVEPLDGACTVEVTATLCANTGNQTFPDEPDAIARAWGRVLAPAASLDRNGCIGLAHRTTFSERATACVASFEAATERVERTVEPDSATAAFTLSAGPGRPATVVQRTAYALGASPEADALLDEAASTLDRWASTSIEEALSGQREVLDRFWDVAVVDVDGDDDVQGAIRFSAFQIFQAHASGADRPGQAKSLTGQGYQGHHLWDQEVYVVHALALLHPEAARGSLDFRHRTLPEARERAAKLSLAGAQYPWRTIDGREASAFMPGGPAQHHVNAAVAWAIGHYVACTGDRGWLDTKGVEVLVETARCWWSLGHFGPDDRFRIETVTGPDEYTAMVDNNLYTNVMAAANLEMAANEVESLRRRDPDAHRALVRSLDLRPEELEDWRRAAGAVLVPYDAALGLHGQDDSFLDKPVWDLEASDPDRLPLQDHHHLLAIYRHQVVKQADLVMALFLQRHRFTPEQRRRDFDHYEALTTHDSSLSAPIHAIVAADVGRPDLAWRFTCDAALADLDQRFGTPDHGIHIAAAAGAWLAVAFGFGGLEVGDGALSFRPVLPEAISRLRFRVLYRASVVEVEIRPATTTYRLIEGDPVVICHRGEEVELATGSPVERPT